MNPKKDLCTGVGRFGGGSLFWYTSNHRLQEGYPSCRNEQGHVLSPCISVIMCNSQAIAYDMYIWEL